MKKFIFVVLFIGFTSPCFAVPPWVAMQYPAAGIAISDGVGIGWRTATDAIFLDLGTGQTSAGTALGNASTVEVNGYLNSPFFSFGEYQNFLQQSEAFNTTWEVTNLAAIVANEGISPSGILIAENIPAETVPDGTGQIYQNVTNSTTGNWCFSVWLKAQSGTATINLQIDSSGGAGGETGTAKSVNLTTAWKRYYVTQNLTVEHTTKTVRILNAGNAIVAWGAQLEPTLTPRSYSGDIGTSPITTLTNYNRFNGSLTISNSLVTSGSLTTAAIYSSNLMRSSINSLTTTSTDGIIGQSASAATVGIPVRISPRLRLTGTVWDTGTSSSKTVNFKQEVLPTSGNPGTGQLIWGYDYNAGGYGDLMYLTSAGMLGIGASPTTMLDMTGADNSTVETVRINAAQADVTAADTFIDFRSTTGSEGSIAGTAGAGVIAYNTFTGSHYTQIEDKTGLELYMLLEIVEGTPVFTPQERPEVETYTEGVIEQVKDEEGNDVLDEEGKPKTVVKEVLTKQKEVKKTYTASPKGQLFKSKICATKASKAAVGVYGGTDKEGRDLCLSIGTGYMWVANTGLDLEIGDYLISSDVKGCAERQEDDLYRSSTVGKITENLKWNIGETRRLVKVIYLGG